MTVEHVFTCMQGFKGQVPNEKSIMLWKMLENTNDDDYDQLSALSLYSSTTTLLLSIFLGLFGIDRFYIGDIGLAIAKLLFGWVTFGIWPLIDIFFSYRKAQRKNFETIQEVILSARIFENKS